MEEDEYIPASDEGIGDGLNPGEVRKVMNGVVITTPGRKFMEKKEILFRIKSEIKGYVTKSRKRNQRTSNFVNTISDDIIEAIEVDENATVTFEANGEKYGIKIDLNNRENIAKLSETFRRRVFLCDISDKLLFLYNRVTSDGFGRIISESNAEKERKKNTKPAMLPGMEEAINKEAAKRAELIRSTAIPDPVVSEPSKKKEETEEWSEDW